MNNCIDLQLCEVAYRRTIKGLSVKYVCGLAKTMDNHLSLPLAKKKIVMDIKDKGKFIFAPEHGGSYAQFEKRPLNPALLHYSAIDVFYFDDLRRTLFDRLALSVQTKVKELSTKRLVEYKMANYTPKGREKAIAPRF